jgi:ABC-type transporter Mla subunit MlaD
METLQKFYQIIVNTTNLIAMESSQIFDHITGNTTNLIALVVIGVLTVLAWFGSFKTRQTKLGHFARQAPAILATVGIFFSFWGISIGLIGLDLNEIQNSIPKLLDGLKAKFLASLMGILASIIVRIIQSFAVEKDSEGSSIEEKLSTSLENIYMLLANSKKNSPEGLLEELKNTIEQLPNEFKNQSTLLEGIRSSLSGDGDISVTTQLAKVRIDVRDALKDIENGNKQHIDALNNALTLNFNRLIDKFDEFSRVAAENNSKAFIEALEKAMRDFNNNITEQFGENFKHLNQAVGNLLNWQENYKSHVEKLTADFELNLKGIQTLQSAFADIETRSNCFTETSRELGAVLDKLDLQLQDLDSYIKAFSQVSESAKNAFPVIEENIKKLTTDFQRSTQQSLSDIQSTVASIGESLVDTTQNINSASRNMNDSMEKQSQVIVESVKNQSEILNKSIISTGDSLTETIQNVGRKIQDITDKISETITDSSGIMRDVMNKQKEDLISSSSEFKTIVSTTLHDMSQETQAELKSYQSNLQEIISQQITAIDDHIKKSNSVVSSTIANVGMELEKMLQNHLNVSIKFEKSAEDIAETIHYNEKTLNSLTQDIKVSIEKSLKEMTEQSRASIKEYENSLHNIIMSHFNIVRDSIINASNSYNKLLLENTEKSTNVLTQQTQLLDAALQEELKKAIETMGKHLAALSNQFVQDYRPLTEKLREVVLIAEDLKRSK